VSGAEKNRVGWAKNPDKQRGVEKQAEQNGKSEVAVSGLNLLDMAI